MNDNNLNGNDMMQGNNMPNSNVGSVPTVDNSQVGQVGMPVVDNTSVNAGPVVGDNQVNQGVMPTVDNTSVNASPVIGDNQLNQGVMPTVDNTSVNASPIVGDNQVNQGMAPSMPNSVVNQGAVPSVSNEAVNSGNAVPPKKKSSFLTVLIVILILAIVGVGGFYAYKMFFAGNNGVDVNGGNSEQNGNNGEEIVDSVQSGQTVTVGNYTYSIPSDLVYQVESNILYVCDDANNPTFVVDFIPKPSSYSDYKDKIEVVKAGLVQKGAIISDTGVFNVGGREFILIALVHNNTPETLAITELSGNNSMVMDIFVSSEEAINNAFNAINTVLSGIKTTNNFADTGDSDEISFNADNKSDYSVQANEVDINKLKD